MPGAVGVTRNVGPPAGDKDDVEPDAPIPPPRHARQEAQDLVGDAYRGRVLEPSPPAVDDGSWFADDPLAVTEPGAPVISPLPEADLTWAGWLAEHPDHRDWAADRWLGAYRRLVPPPAELAETRLALHRVGAYVLSPARRRVNGKIALRWTRGGFGTPFFGADEQVRVEGTTLVRQRGDAVQAEALTTLARAADLALDGPPDLAWAEGFDVPDAGDLAAPLALDTGAAAWLGDWYGLAWSVLEELRADAESGEPSRVQLWPEHFDAAVDCTAGTRRATFGASPGDAGVGRPYLYVISGGAPLPEGDLWNATTFAGAVLVVEDLVAAADQRGAALGFYRACRAALAG